MRLRAHHHNYIDDFTYSYRPILVYSNDVVFSMQMHGLVLYISVATYCTCLELCKLLCLIFITTIVIAVERIWVVSVLGLTTTVFFVVCWNQTM